MEHISGAPVLRPSLAAMRRRSSSIPNTAVAALELSPLPPPCLTPSRLFPSLLSIASLHDRFEMNTELSLLTSCLVVLVLRWRTRNLHISDDLELQNIDDYELRSRTFLGFSSQY